MHQIPRCSIERRFVVAFNSLKPLAYDPKSCQSRLTRRSRNANIVHINTPKSSYKYFIKHERDLITLSLQRGETDKKILKFEYHKWPGERRGARNDLHSVIQYSSARSVSAHNVVPSQRWYSIKSDISISIFRIRLQVKWPLRVIIRLFAFLRLLLRRLVWQLFLIFSFIVSHVRKQSLCEFIWGLIDCRLSAGFVTTCHIRQIDISIGIPLETLELESNNSKTAKNG